MKSFRAAPFLLLAVYSIVLVGIELRTSQDHVRHYFTDIYGPVRLYAINTTLTTFLLWSCVLIFAIQLLLIELPAANRKASAFCGSQILVFGYLGFDDRFLVHEQLSEILAIQDTLILVAIAGVEAGCLIVLGELPGRSRKTLAYLASAAIAFLIMSGIDALAPSELTLRLAFEDLAKAWAAFFLFLFSWEILKIRIQCLATRNTPRPSEGSTAP